MKRGLMLTLVSLVVLAGCRGQTGTIPLGGGGAGPGGAGGPGGGGASTTAAGRDGGITVAAEAEEQRRLLEQLIVYFEFDRADIRPEFNALLAAHGQYLASNPNALLRLEGHADERGSREYNIGLGELRAQAVRRILMLQGASASQVSTVSYGEERPASLGSDEEAYSLNRRVELVYQSGGG
jgi:peptidoglycan-associated lipoprotein